MHPVSTIIAKDGVKTNMITINSASVFARGKYWPWFMSLIITLVCAKFTLSFLLSMQLFHAAYLTLNSSKRSAVITKSSAYNISEGRMLLHSLERVSSTIINNKVQQ